MLSSARVLSRYPHRPFFVPKPGVNRCKNLLHESRSYAHSTSRRHSLNEPTRTTVSESTAHQSPLVRRLLYRWDGSPRSKTRGLLIGTLVISLAYLVKISVEVEDFFYRIEAVLDINTIDSEEYKTVDFDSYHSTCSYFSKILTPLLVKPGYVKPESIQTFFTDLSDNKKMQFENFGQQKLHAIMRDAAKEIHESLDNPHEVPKLKEMEDIVTGALEMMQAELHLQRKGSEELAGWIKSLKEGRAGRKEVNDEAILFWLLALLSK
ncbi:hypothetical protein D9758_005541 [Tetrapyrgos nigripes]|uniref:Uncharacterized protein n=1 Tax=Tetrapyrgos nigripes TaxID=182062 RepID=A0A8H5GH04_9AGAR|nr:hypothetical protein D9758_005541 [Tetrapyrgos nigripes]